MRDYGEKKSKAVYSVESEESGGEKEGVIKREKKRGGEKEEE